MTRTPIRNATAMVDLDRERGWFPGGYLVVEDGVLLTCDPSEVLLRHRKRAQEPQGVNF